MATPAPRSRRGRHRSWLIPARSSTPRSCPAGLRVEGKRWRTGSRGPVRGRAGPCWRGCWPIGSGKGIFGRRPRRHAGKPGIFRDAADEPGATRIPGLRTGPRRLEREIAAPTDPPSPRRIDSRADRTRPGFASIPRTACSRRYPLRRLDAEAVRDAMLAASGELDERPGGPYVPTHRTEEGEVVVVEDSEGAPSPIPLSSAKAHAGPESARRLRRPVDRHDLHPSERHDDASAIAQPAQFRIRRGPRSSSSPTASSASPGRTRGDS